MRLDKLISNATVFTRSQTGKIIRKGLITVNGEVVRKSAHHINAKDQVHYMGVEINLPTSRYLMMHKPQGVVCAGKDSEHPTVFDSLFISNRGNLHIAGRLDIDTTGLILLTDDGQWSHRITSPKHKKEKIYRVTLAEPIDSDVIDTLQKGVLLKGEEKPTLPCRIERLDDTTILMGLVEGKYHQVKRMLAAVGNRVENLHRQQIGKIVLDATLQPGEWRELINDEINLD